MKEKVEQIGKMGGGEASLKVKERIDILASKWHSQQAYDKRKACTIDSRNALYTL